MAGGPVSTFPVTSVTLIAKIKDLGPGEDSAEWVRFWDSYSLAIRQFAVMKGGEENADDGHGGHHRELGRIGTSNEFCHVANAEDTHDAGKNGVDDFRHLGSAIRHQQDAYDRNQVDECDHEYHLSNGRWALFDNNTISPESGKSISK